MYQKGKVGLEKIAFLLGIIENPRVFQAVLNTMDRDIFPADQAGYLGYQVH
jgi:hypothetical protein